MREVFYDYFEEWPLGDTCGTRRRNVSCRVAEEFYSEKYTPSSIYGWRRTREIEERASAPDSEGIWSINELRVSRFLGTPGVADCPRDTKQHQLTSEMDISARKMRLHHYSRVRDAQQCRVILQKNQPVVLSLEITEDWFDPPNGAIPIPERDCSFLAAHAVVLVDYQPRQDSFEFPNSWGEDWGNQGWGLIPATYFDRAVIEAWHRKGDGAIPPMQITSGIACLAWKSSIDSEFGVHGREIVDASTGDRVAWAFAVRKGNYLDIEEFFVWPTYRGKGYGRILAEMILKLAAETKCELRAWVPFADCEEANRPALVAIFELLGLHLQPADVRWAGYMGTTGSPAKCAAPVRIPPRPASVREQLAQWEYTVWYGTNRKPVDPADPSKGYGSERDQKTHFGTCHVAIPKSHSFGRVDGSWWRRLLRIKDRTLHVRRRIGMGSEHFWSGLRDEIAKCPQGERHSLVFLHGYNVTFDEAAARAAQIGFDLKMPGATAFFSWPSQGRVNGYPADEASIEASEAAITEFLTHFVQEVPSDNVYLIAHSMGNRGLLRALQRMAQTVDTPSSVKFKQVILAAPDIDVDLFHDLATACHSLADRTTLYASSRDGALTLSGWVHSYPRAGFIPPVTVVEGVDTIAVPKFNLLDLGHSYLAEAAAILHDIHDLIRHNTAPTHRQRLVQMETDDGRVYWRVLE